MKAAFRWFEVLQKYYKNPSENVKLACSRAVKEIYKNCLFKESNSNK